MKQYYNKMYRNKQMQYFADKNSKDFKNSKKFGSFYSSIIKLKKDSNQDDTDINLNLNNQIISDKP